MVPGVIDDSSVVLEYGMIVRAWVRGTGRNRIVLDARGEGGGRIVMQHRDVGHPVFGSNLRDAADV